MDTYAPRSERQLVDVENGSLTFKEAEVDLNAEIDFAEHLLKISPRAIGLGRVQLDATREVLNGTPSANLTLPSL